MKSKLGIEVSMKLYIIGKRQKWLAEQCGCTKQYISKLFHGRSKPSIEMSEKIAEAIGISASEIRKLALEIA